MFRIFEFIRSIYIVVLFVIAEVIAINHYASSDSYTQARILASTNVLLGGVQGVMHNTQHFVGLPRANRELMARIAELELKVSTLEESSSGDTLSEEVIAFDNPAYTYIVARVVSNSINKHDNFIMLDKGVEDGVRENMAVITPSGSMLGYVAGCSDRYSAALSIISHNFTTSGKLLDGEHFGSIRWGGDDRYRVYMEDLSKYAPINVGDTVVTTGFSNRFPDGVDIGRVVDFTLNEMGTAYKVEIDLAADLSAVDYVLIVASRDSAEIEDLEAEMESNY